MLGGPQWSSGCDLKWIWGRLFKSSSSIVFMVSPLPTLGAAAAAATSLQLCPTLWDPIDGSPPGSPVPGIFQAGTRVGCHFLLQCTKGKSEREVAQLCPTLSNLVDWSLRGSSAHGVGCYCLLWTLGEDVSFSVLARESHSDPHIAVSCFFKIN